MADTHIVYAAASNCHNREENKKATKLIILSARHSSHMHSARSKHTRHHRSFSLKSTPWFAFYFSPFWSTSNERFFVFMLFFFFDGLRVRLLFYFIMLISSCHFISGWVLVVLFLFYVHAIIWTFYGTWKNNTTTTTSPECEEQQSERDCCFTIDKRSRSAAKNQRRPKNTVWPCVCILLYCI